MNVAEAKKAIAERQCPNLDPRCHCHTVRRSDFETIIELEKSVREDINSNEHHNTTVEIGSVDRYWLGWLDAKKEVLGEEK